MVRSVRLREGAALVKVRLLVLALEAEVSQMSIEEGMRKIIPQDRKWAQAPS